MQAEKGEPARLVETNFLQAGCSCAPNTVYLAFSVKNRSAPPRFQLVASGVKGLEGVRFLYLSRKRVVNGLIVRQNCQAAKNPMETFLSGRAAELTGTSPPHRVP